MGAAGITRSGAGFAALDLGWSCTDRPARAPGSDFPGPFFRAVEAPFFLGLIGHLACGW